MGRGHGKDDARLGAASLGCVWELEAGEQGKAPEGATQAGVES